jgi:LmbE family N-acetylglucosaminyl deacetylase
MSDQESAAWQARCEAWYRYLEGVVRAVEDGRRLPLGPSPTPLNAPPVARQGGELCVAFCAPHPDDESLSGALALRLRLEQRARAVNIAITLGSDPARKVPRLRELESACRVLGFELVVPLDPKTGTAGQPMGLDAISPEARRSDPETWRARVDTLSKTFDRLHPDVVFAPHADDFNTTHIGVHFLVVEALAEHLKRKGLAQAVMPLVETEFWHPMAGPNLMVGVPPGTVAIQLMAAAEHGGEMTRNPYHLRHACRLMDNVRRGSEVVGGQGAAAQNFDFAELHRIAFVTVSGLLDPRPGGRFVGPAEPIDFKSIARAFLPEGYSL